MLLLVPIGPKFVEFEVTHVVLFDSHVVDIELLVVVQFRFVSFLVMAGVAEGIFTKVLILCALLVGIGAACPG